MGTTDDDHMHACMCIVLPAGPYIYRCRQADIIYQRVQRTLYIAAIHFDGPVHQTRRSIRRRRTPFLHALISISQRVTAAATFAEVFVTCCFRSLTRLLPSAVSSHAAAYAIYHYAVVCAKLQETTTASSKNMVIYIRLRQKCVAINDDHMNIIVVCKIHYQ